MKLQTYGSAPKGNSEKLLMLTKNKKIRAISGVSLGLILLVTLAGLISSGPESQGSGGESQITGNVVVNPPDNTGGSNTSQPNSSENGQEIEAPGANITLPPQNQTGQNQTNESKEDPWVPHPKNCRALLEEQEYSNPRFKKCLEAEGMFPPPPSSQQSGSSQSSDSRCALTPEEQEQCSAINACECQQQLFYKCNTGTLYGGVC